MRFEENRDCLVVKECRNSVRGSSRFRTDCVTEPESATVISFHDKDEASLSCATPFCVNQESGQDLLSVIVRMMNESSLG